MHFISVDALRAIPAASLPVSSPAYLLPLASKRPASPQDAAFSLLPARRGVGHFHFSFSLPSSAPRDDCEGAYVFLPPRTPSS